MDGLHSLVKGQGPVVVLSHALGCDLHMWDEVAADLCADHLVVRYDHRGHGRSQGGRTAFDMGDLADDAAELIAQLTHEPVHFVGVSMGGMAAQALAVRHPQRVRSITVAHAASHYAADAQAGWEARIATVQAQGMEAIADGALQRWLTPDYVAGHPKRVAQLRSTLVQTDPVAYAQACRAVANIALQAGNARITCPSLVIAGTHDAATPLACSQAIAAQIPGGQLVCIDAAHIGCVEQPAAFAALVRQLVQRAEPR